MYIKRMHFYSMVSFICCMAVLAFGISVGIEKPLYAIVCLVVAVLCFRMSYKIYKKLEERYDEQFRR